MKLPFAQRRLGEILDEMGFADQKRIDTALNTSGEGLIGERLLQAGVIGDEQLAEALADQFGLPYVNLEDFAVPAEIFESLPAIQAYRLGVLPYHRDGNTLQVVISDPGDLTLPEKLEKLSGLAVKTLLAPRSAIEAAMRRSEGRAEVLRDVSEEFRFEMVKETEEGIEETISLEAIAGGSSVINLINTLLVAALQKRASDIHIETYEHGLAVKFRIDGVLYPATDVLDRRHHSAVVSRLKVMSELDIAEKRIPQDGRYKLRVNGRDIDFRVSILPSIHGEDVVIRILDKSSLTEGMESLSLTALGIEPSALKKLRRSIREPYGMVLITGPTGSGKTTTLYAALNELNTLEEKIITIEDPVEYQLEGVVQIPVNEKKELTFARGLRSILRHDPDKIMVGEIRDGETVQIAVQSALTGHLVFTTVHANNAFDVIGRFVHMGVDLHSFVSALNCVLAQRLVRKICTHCKNRFRPGKESLQESGLDPARYKKASWAIGKGCGHCNGTGFRGRTAVAEYLDLSLRLRELILERRPMEELRAAAKEEGMITLRDTAIRKAVEGETTLAEVNRVTFVE